jgi:hypothetical protein
MVAERVARSLGLLCLATTALGCGGPEEATETSAPVSVAAVTDNGLAMNGLAMNGLAMNGLAMNGLAMNGLAMNGLAMNGLAMNGLTDASLADPQTQQFLKYLVSCALGPQQSLTWTTAGGTTYTFPGQLGLAPQWAGTAGSCDGSCQRWVSACLLARVDAAGIDREISIRGPNLALIPSAREISQYTQKEATYFGNLFIPGQPRFLCLAPGQKEDERVCGDSLADCPMTVEGSCAQDCAVKGGAFGDAFCSDSGRFGTGQTYLESVTVFLPK